MALFRKLNARKAKFGFESTICIEDFEALAQSKVFIESRDPEALVMLNLNMSSKQFLVYTNDEQVALAFESKYC